MSATSAEAEQAERGLSGLVETFRRVGRTSDRGWIEERDRVISIATGMPVAAINPTFVVAPPRDPAGALERARAFYAGTGVDGEVNASGATATAIADAAWC